MRTKGCKAKETKRIESSLRERGSRKGTNFWKVDVTDVTPTKNISFFSLSGDVR